MLGIGKTVQVMNSKGKGTGFSITGHEGPQGMWMQGSTALGRGRAVSPTLGRLYPEKVHGTHFIGG